MWGVSMGHGSRPSQASCSIYSTPDDTRVFSLETYSHSFSRRNLCPQLQRWVGVTQESCLHILNTPSGYLIPLPLSQKPRVIWGSCDVKWTGSCPPYCWYEILKWSYFPLIYYLSRFQVCCCVSFPISPCSCGLMPFTNFPLLTFLWCFGRVTLHAFNSHAYSNS